MTARLLHALLAGLALFGSFAASGDESPVATATQAPAVMDPLSEAIRERIDHLRYEIEHDHRDHSVQGERIVLGDTVARYYESQQFRPQWRDPARLGAAPRLGDCGAVRGADPADQVAGRGGGASPGVHAPCGVGDDPVSPRQRRLDRGLRRLS